MAKAKKSNEALVDEAATTSDEQAVAQAEFDASAETHNSLKEALDEAAVDLEEKRAALDAVLNPPPAPITGPRIRIENGPIVQVEAEDLKMPRLLLFGKNFEHVSDETDQEELIWVYRQM